MQTILSICLFFFGTCGGLGTVTNAVDGPVSPVPSALSLNSFGQMKLEGNDLIFEEVISKNRVYTSYGISYNSNGLRISGVMNIPNAEGMFPLVILNHGYIDPDIYTRGRGLKREQDFLARNGFVVLHTDYRGHALSDSSSGSFNAYDAGIEYAIDSINAIHAVKEANVKKVNIDKIAMFGHSMGGGVTLNIATQYPELIDAIILYASVHSDAWENFARWRYMRDATDETIDTLGTRESNPTAWDKLSSLTYLYAIDDPILVFHGAKDLDVPKKWSDFLVDRLNVLKKDVTYVEYPREGHEFVGKFYLFMQRTVEFLHATFG